MKKSIKVMAAMLLVVVMMFSLTACGIDMNKVKGDWTCTSIGGKDIATLAAEKGVYQAYLVTNYTITDNDIKADSLNPDGSGAHVTGTYTLKKRSNGVEGYLGDQVVISLIYDEKADTLTMKVGIDEASAVAYVFTKGNTNLDELLASQMNGGVADGGEEGAEESYEEDEE